MKSIKLLSITLFSVFFSLMSVVQVAEAKRFGGGKSLGYNKQIAPKSYSNQTTSKSPSATKPAANTNTAKTGSAKWLGPLAGIAAGGFLMAMLFGEGFEGIQLFDILVFAMIAFLLFKLFASRATSARSPAQGYQAPQKSETMMAAQQRQQYEDVPAQQGSIIGADVGKPLGQGMSDNAELFDTAPAWFDEQRFVSDAKQHFVTLQQAWDSVDLQTLEDYCSEELFESLKAELVGFEPGHSLTIVDTLYAEVATMAMDGDYFIVSIRFSGFIEEQMGEGAHAFNEIWHIRRLADDQGNWQIAGIQQAGASL